jgi:hypothetical protein
VFVFLLVVRDFSTIWMLQLHHDLAMKGPSRWKGEDVVVETGYVVEAGYSNGLGISGRLHFVAENL